MSEVPALPNEVRFADVRVDTRAHQVFRAGSPVPLEPKAYAVLVELLRRPGAAIARDDLLDQVWGHRHVTPGVLNRIIAMLRRELGDDAEHPHLIRTVHGTGYSFIGSLLPVDAVATETPTAPPAARAPRRSLVLPLAALAAVLLAALSLWPREAPQAPAVPAPTPVPTPATAIVQSPLLVVLPLRSPTGTAADVELAAGLGDSLEEALRRVPGLRVIARESMEAVASDTPDRSKIAAALGATHVLTGAAGERVAGVATLDLELFDAAAARAPWSRRFEQPRARASSMLGPALGELQAALLGDATPRSVDPVFGATIGAQDLYWLARRHQLENSPAGASRSLPLLEQAVAQDPSFALAWSAIAEAHRMLANAGKVPLEESVAAGSAAARRALELDPDLAAGWLQKALIETIQWRAVEAEAPARRAMELAPDDFDVVSINGNIALYLGRPREALVLHRRAIAINPRSNYAPALLGYDLLALGDFDAAMAESREAWRDPTRFWASDVMRRGRVSYGRLALAAGPPVPMTPYGILASVQAASMLGRHDEAEAQLARVDVRPPRPPAYLATRLDVFWRRGAKSEAVEWLRGEGRQIAQQPWLDAGLAQALAVAGDDAAALRTYDATLADPAARDRLAYSWYPTRIGIGHVANWIALRRAAGKSYTAELSALRGVLDGFRANGVAHPAMHYHYAVQLLLEDDPSGAQAELTHAIDKGWLDVVALDTDFAWRLVANEPWLAAARERIARKLADEANRPAPAKG